jgi:glycogen debranching enzyme
MKTKLKPSKNLDLRSILAGQRDQLVRFMNRFVFSFRLSRGLALRFVLVCGLAVPGIRGFAQEPKSSLELSRPIRSWEFVSAVGQHAALFGNEGGSFEAWVYPVKIFRDFHLRFRVGNTVLPAETLARTLIVRPESSTIVYTGDVFSVRETLFVPVHESGAVISFEVQTTEPLEIEAIFHPDFQLEWPAAFGGAGGDWDPALRAFRFADESRKFEAIVGSPTGVEGSEEQSTNYYASEYDSIFLGPTAKGPDTKLLVIAAAFDDKGSLPQFYHHLAADYPSLLRISASYYSDYLDRTISLDLPDKQIENAYDWSKISMVQGVVQNPFLGEGLIAGYNKSGDDFRPGFAWFFGRDAEWTSLALNAEGDFPTARTALEFLSKYQRADGKITHEISQSASLVGWFKTSYAYDAADATPLFLIAIDNYVTRSGDAEFARQKWDNLWRAYEFLRSTYDAQGFAENVGAGTGWIEGGPLYPVRTEIYQASLGIEAVRALSHLAHLLEKNDLAKELEEAFEHQRPLLDKTFWSPEQKSYGYAIDKNNQLVDVPSVLGAVPMWFEQLDANHAESMIENLASPSQQTDWGMRIISSHDPRYDPGGYHYGTVWPLFTGWASIGEYRYHRALPAYSNLRANALLALDGSLGHVAEVLSGDYYQTLATGSPQQIWSAAMVVNPLLTGLLGLRADATICHLDFSPHVPAEWSAFSVNHVVIGAETLDLRYRRTADAITLEVQSTGTERCSLEFSPALSLRAKITRVELNGRTLPFHLQTNSSDQHVSVSLPLTAGKNTLEMQMKDDFEIGESANLPPLGTASRGLRVISESWTPSRDALTLVISGAAGESYELSAWNPGQISSVQGGNLEKGTAELAKVRLQLPESAPGVDPQATVVFHLVAR